jgi:hypothetical protein
VAKAFTDADGHYELIATVSDLARHQARGLVDMMVGAWTAETGARTIASTLIMGSDPQHDVDLSPVTWTNGAELGSRIGLDLSSRSGFTTAVSNRWDFYSVNKNRKWLCGINADAPSAYNHITWNTYPS